MKFLTSLLVTLFALSGCVEDGGGGAAAEGENDASGASADASQSGDDAGAGGEGGEGGSAGEGGTGGTGGAPEVDAAVDPPDAGDPVPDAALGDAPTGAPCAEDGDCAGGRCQLGEEWAEGYCTGACDRCGEGDVCTGFAMDFCAAGCETDDDCRMGYACTEVFGETVCLPGERTLAVDGAPCEADDECEGGTCITDWPGGYCTTQNCRNFEDCARGPSEVDNRCLPGANPPICVRICQAGERDACRDEYICQPIQGSLGICVPDPNTPFLPRDQVDELPFDVLCTGPERGNQFRLDFEVAEDTTAYLFTPFTTGGGQMRPAAIQAPGEDIEFNGPNQFQLAPASLFGGLNPTMVPAHGGFADQLQSGPHTYVLNADDDEVCGYLLEESAAGDRIDLNVYLVGLPGITAENAGQSQDLQAVLDRFAEIYEPTGVGLGRVRYYEFDPEVTERFSVIRSQDDIGAVLEFTERQPDADSAVTMNVVFTRQFAIPGQGTLGVSMGLPGPAGLHGTRASGVVFTGQYIGQRFRDGGGNEVDGNPYTGQILAHEIGHYVGLFHSSEQNGRSFDPLDDTPQCRNFNAGCDDIDNLMFPFARSQSGELSPLQGSVIQFNPLSRQEAP